MACRDRPNRVDGIYGMTADLILASRGTPNDAAERSIIKVVLLDTRYQAAAVDPETSLPSAAISVSIAIAWKPTPQAARAVALALPFSSEPTKSSR